MRFWINLIGGAILIGVVIDEWPRSIIIPLAFSVGIWIVLKVKHSRRKSPVPRPTTRAPRKARPRPAAAKP